MKHKAKIKNPNLNSLTAELSSPLTSLIFFKLADNLKVELDLALNSDLRIKLKLKS